MTVRMAGNGQTFPEVAVTAGKAGNGQTFSDAAINTEHPVMLQMLHAPSSFRVVVLPFVTNT